MAELERFHPDRDPKIQLLLKRPSRHSFFQAMRAIESSHLEMPRVGFASSPTQEAFRIQQPADLAFAPSTIDSAATGTDGKVAVEQRFFGLLGPAGPLPLHLTEIVRNRARHSEDDALQSFLDMFHHRMASLFYRAWSSARPAVQRDRPEQDRFAIYLGALVGIGMKNGRGRDAWRDESKAYFAGHLGSLRRNAEGLAALIESVANTKVVIQPFALRWLALPAEDGSKLGGTITGTTQKTTTNCLGRSALLGTRVPDRQSSIEVTVGPLSYNQFQSFLPGSPLRDELRSVIQTHSGTLLEARFRTLLRKEEVPATQLGKTSQLGRNAWIQSKSIDRDRDDFCFESSQSNSSMTKRQP